MSDSEKLIEEINNIDNQFQNLFLNYIKNDYLENLAKTYVNLSDDNKTIALQNLNKDIAEEVINRAEKYKKNDEEVMLQAFRILGEKEFNEKNLNNYKSTIKKLPIRECDEIILKYEQTNPFLFFTLCNIQNVTIEDLLILDDRAIQKILREIDQNELAKALKGTDTEIQDKIFRNMSNRAATMLKEDMEFMGPVRIRDVEEAQQNIIEIIIQLEKNGEIIIPRNSGDEIID